MLPPPLPRRFPSPSLELQHLQVKKGKVDRSIFDGSTINTPSMLCVEDYIDALQWCDTVGGLNGLIKRSEVCLYWRAHACACVCLCACACLCALCLYALGACRGVPAPSGAQG